MSDSFSMYEDKFNEVVNEIKEKISSFSTLPRDKAEFVISTSSHLFKKAEGVLLQMELETSGNGTLISLNKVKQYKTEFNSLQHNFQLLQDKHITQKAENAIILNTEDQEIKKMRHKDSGLIANENGSDNIKFDSVNISNSLDKKQIDENEENKQECVEIQESNPFNLQTNKKNRRLLILTSIVIIIVLILLIVLFSVIL